MIKVCLSCTWNVHVSPCTLHTIITNAVGIISKQNIFNTPVCKLCVNLYIRVCIKSAFHQVPSAIYPTDNVNMQIYYRTKMWSSFSRMPRLQTFFFFAKCSNSDAIGIRVFSMAALCIAFLLNSDSV